MQTLFEAYNAELARLNRAIGIYRSLPDNAGLIGAAFISQTVQQATDALNNGDTVAMLPLFEEMKNTAKDCG